MKYFRFLACVLAVFTAGSTQAGITINSNESVVGADDGVSPGVDQYFNDTTIPTSTNVDAVDGDTYSKNAINWSDSGSQTILKFDLDQKRPGLHNADAHSIYTLNFTTDSDRPYLASGYYNATDVESTSGLVQMRVRLSDEYTGDGLLESGQDSKDTPNQQFLLGNTDGDLQNIFSGSLSGALTAGHPYKLFILFWSAAYPDADTGASALGNFTLTIGQPYPLGDFNHNFVVDAADYIVWRLGDIAADGNHDEYVDGLDYDLWRSHFGETVPASANLATTTVPEPSTLILCLAAIFASQLRRNRSWR